MLKYNEVERIDPEVASAIYDEINRQKGNIELIASENFVSRAVLEACGTPLTNKYAGNTPKNALWEAASMWTWLKPGYSKSQGAFWRRACQCSAPFGRPGKYGRVLCDYGAR